MVTKIRQGAPSQASLENIEKVVIYAIYNLKPIFYKNVLKPLNSIFIRKEQKIAVSRN